MLEDDLGRSRPPTGAARCSSCVDRRARRATPARRPSAPTIPTRPAEFVVPALGYPKAGTTNSAARAGVVSASGGPTVWLQVPGDPRNNYIVRMDWAASSGEVGAPTSQSGAEHPRGDVGQRADREDADRADRARQRLGRRGRRPPLHRRRQELHLDQRAGRLAPSLRDLPGRQEHPAGHQRRLRPPQPLQPVRRAPRGRRGLGGRHHLLHRVAAERDRSSTSIAAGSTARASRSGSRRRTSRDITCTRSPRTAIGPCTPTPRSAPLRWSIWCGFPPTRWCAPWFEISG